MLFLLIKENIEDLKDLLTRLYPEVKSSHLSESIARALGYNTHAALLVDLKKSQKPKIILRTFDGTVLFSWLKEKDYELNESALDYQSFEKFYVPPYIVTDIRNRDRRTKLMKNRFLTCKTYNIPFVSVYLKNKYAIVEWDYISVDEFMEDFAATKGDLNRIRKFLRNIGGCRKYEFSAMTGYVEMSSFEKAEEFAMFIFSLLHGFIRG